MFPMDAQTIFELATSAWVNGCVAWLQATAATIQTHWIQIVLIPVCFSLIYAVARSWWTLLEKRAMAQNIGLDDRKPHRIMQFIRTASKPLLVLALGSYVLYTALLVIAAGLLLFVVPFARVGAEVAAKHAATGFRNSPEVVLQSPDGVKASYRIIECYGSFCALFRDGRAYTVPSSAVTWAISPRPQPNEE